MKTLLIILSFIAIQAKSQTYFFMEENKFVDSSYKVPATVLGAGYKYKLLTAEAGFRTNWNEDYTYVFAGLGFEYKSAVLLQANFGAGIMLSLPMMDRHGTVVLKQGYTTKSIGLGYYGARAGVRVWNVQDGGKLYLCASYNKTGNFKWAGVGLIFSGN